MTEEVSFLLRVSETYGDESTSSSGWPELSVRRFMVTTEGLQGANWSNYVFPSFDSLTKVSEEKEVRLTSNSSGLRREIKYLDNPISLSTKRIS